MNLGRRATLSGVSLAEGGLRGRARRRKDVRRYTDTLAGSQAAPKSSFHPPNGPICSRSSGSHPWTGELRTSRVFLVSQPLSPSIGEVEELSVLEDTLVDVLGRHEPAREALTAVHVRAPVLRVPHRVEPALRNTRGRRGDLHCRPDWTVIVISSGVTRGTHLIAQLSQPLGVGGHVGHLGRQLQREALGGPHAMQRPKLVSAPGARTGGGDCLDELDGVRTPTVVICGGICLTAFDSRISDRRHSRLT
jgi:hypothetical protein